MIKKTVGLSEDVKDNNGVVIAHLSTELTGMGETPRITTVVGSSTVIGYADNGTPIMASSDEEKQQIIKDAEQKMMAIAIKEQKKLCVENGVDPDLVNIIGLEKKESNKNEQ